MFLCKAHEIRNSTGSLTLPENFAQAGIQTGAVRAGFVFSSLPAVFCCVWACVASLLLLAFLGLACFGFGFVGRMVMPIVSNALTTCSWLAPFWISIVLSRGSKWRMLHFLRLVSPSIRT